MSALNVCFKEDRAIIMQDGACYNKDGVVIDFVDKGVEVPELGCYLACTGARSASFFLSKLLPNYFDDIDDVGDRGEAVLDYIYEHLADTLEEYGSRPLMAVVAGWSKKHNRPRIVVYQRGPYGEGFAGDVGYNVHPALEGAAKDVWLRHHGIEFNIVRFDPVRDGLKLLELQRSMLLPIEDGRPRAHLVGGHVTLTEVGRAGIKSRLIHTWGEDKIGERIMPAPLLDVMSGAKVVPIAGVNRAERRRLEKMRRGKAA